MVYENEKGIRRAVGFSAGEVLSRNPQGTSENFTA